MPFLVLKTCFKCVLFVFWIHNITIIYTGRRCQNINNYYLKKKKTWKICLRDSKHFFAFEHERKYFFLGENLLTNYEP
jgi:hypothetical protein